VDLDDPELTSDEPDTATGQHHIAFLPYLRLKSGSTIAGVDFFPLRDGTGTVPQPLQAAIKSIEKILSGYVDRRGKPFTNCVVATILGKGWDIAPEDFPTVQWAASLLFLGAWARNEYLAKFGGKYVNSSMFRVIGQAYTGTVPHYISIGARRRDGSSTDGGYKHGELKFHLPPQVSIREPATIDQSLLAALDKAHAANSPVIDRLRTALPFVELANTDEDWMNERPEAILMGSAFEQLLHGNASAYKLGRKFGGLFGSFGNVTVADAMKVRPKIEIDESKPEYAKAQPKWWVHRKWMEELYDVRSKVVHEGTAAARPWGWSLFEHLVMAAHLFPLTVKVLLQREGHYTLNDDDQVACRAVDKILASPKWWSESNHENEVSKQSWSEILLDTRFEIQMSRAIDLQRRKNP
jgi:hypothetical protein